MEYLLNHNDVLAVLPTGYAKSLIFQLFAVAASIERKEQQIVLVVCPLKSIIEDQIAKAESMGIPAVSAVDISEDEFRAAILKFYHRFRWYANTRGNISKISVSLKCYRQIGSKSTNHSPLAWRKEGQKATLVAVIGGFWSDLFDNTQDCRKFWKRFRGCFVFQSRVSTETVVKTTCNIYSNHSGFVCRLFSHT